MSASSNIQASLFGSSCTGTGKYDFVALIGLFLLFVYWFVNWLRSDKKRQAAIALVKQLCESDQDTIRGRSVAYWLDELNKNQPFPIHAFETTILPLEGHRYFFIEGGQYAILSSTKNPSPKLCELGCLIAVGEPAVKYLAEHKRIFRRICGTTELAAFSVFRWKEFFELLTREQRRAKNQRSEIPKEIGGE